MHPADSSAHREEGCAERLPVLRISYDGGKRYFAGAICRGGPGGDQSRASERRTKGLRRPLQEVSSFLDDWSGNSIGILARCLRARAFALGKARRRRAAMTGVKRNG